jgi:signal transduction histidine kinase
MTLIGAPGWPWHRRVRVRWAGVWWAQIATVAFALALSAYVVVLVRIQAGGAAACVAATAMTLPVAFARRAPLAAAATLAAAAAANELFCGHLFRCGAALPAVFFVAYLAGRACAGRARTLVLAGVLVSAVIQCLYDPRLGAAVIALMAAASGVFAGAGVLVRRRAGLVAELRRRTRQLQEQREQTAALAVAAERARITADISGTLRERIDEIGRLARPGGDEIDARFAEIELAGRAILDSMRQVVGTLRDTPTEPEPGLAELEGLLARATTAATRLSVEGPARPLPASLELTGYRIVEQLLTVLRDEPAAQVEVSVSFASDCLELRVAGPPAAGCELRRLRSTVQARLALFGGTIDIDDSAGRRAARIRLPLVTSHA